MTGPDADELRIRSILRQRGVGPAAELPPKPTRLPDGYEPRERDWLDDIIETPTPKATPEPEPAASVRPAEARKPKPSVRKKRRKRRPKPGAARTAWDTEMPSPRQSLLDAWDAVPYRLRWLGYHATAAFMGWTCGLVDYTTYVTAWIADTGAYGPQAIFWYVVGAATFLLHHATRRRWWPVAWLSAVPAASVVVGVLLYGNGWTELELSL